MWGNILNFMKSMNMTEKNLILFVHDLHIGKTEKYVR